MRSLCSAFWLSVAVVGGLTSSGVCDEQPLLTVRLTTGQTLRGTLDPQTGSDRLWLKFGTETTSVSRGLSWQQVAEILQGEQPVSPAELIRVNAVPQPVPETRGRHIIVPPGPLGMPAAAPRPTQRTSVSTVTFDAWLDQWDRDVETDGLTLQVTALDNQGVPVDASGTLTVELFAIYRIPQNSKPHGRGRDFRLVNSWTTTVHCEQVKEHSTRVQLPFRANHPETDPNWSPFGLAHIRLAIPGHGVFHHSIDGIRLRPYSPTRDLRQLQSESRYFASEIN